MTSRDPEDKNELGTNRHHLAESRLIVPTVKILYLHYNSLIPFTKPKELSLILEYGNPMSNVQWHVTASASTLNSLRLLSETSIGKVGIQVSINERNNRAAKIGII